VPSIPPPGIITSGAKAAEIDILKQYVLHKRTEREVHI